MLLAGLQNLSSFFLNNYPILQPFSGVSTVPPMFTETSLNQSCSIQPTISHQNNKNIIYPHTLHETQTHPKTHQTEKSISKFTTNLKPYSHLLRIPLYFMRPLYHKMKHYLIP